MEQLKSLQEFETLNTQMSATARPDMPTIIIPAGTCGRASGVLKIIREVQREILMRNLQEKIRLRITGCHGFCEMEPSVLIEPSGTFYPKVNAGAMKGIIDATLNGEVVHDLLYVDADTGEAVEKTERYTLLP